MTNKPRVCALCDCDEDEMCPDCLCHPEITTDDVAEMSIALKICGNCMSGDHEECFEVATIFPSSGPCECRTCGGGTP